jgi:hypothetical protein
VVQVTIKGCRSEVKVYTDLAVGVKGMGGAFGVGLQPTIGLVRLQASIKAHACGFLSAPGL